MWILDHECKAGPRSCFLIGRLTVNPGPARYIHTYIHSTKNTCTRTQGKQPSAKPSEIETNMVDESETSAMSEPMVPSCERTGR